MHYKGETALRKLLEKYHGKGDSYDCIVPISGGKDSTYVLYSAVKEFGMRALALNYDSGFATDQAKRNLEKAIESLQVDFVRITSKHDIQKKCLKDCIEAWAAKPSSEYFPELCYGCREGFLEGAYRIAAKKGVPLILLGKSEVEKDSSKIAFHKHHRSYYVHLAIRFLRNPHYLHPRRLYHFLLVQAPKLHNHVHRLISKSAPLVVHWFDYIPYDDRRILPTVIEKMGWSKPASSASSWRFDCKIGAVKDKMYRQKGFNMKEEVYSKMIREGTLTRQAALNLIEQENSGYEAAMASDVLRQLGMPEKSGELLFGRPSEAP